MLVSNCNKSRGDTLIEVLFAITIFSSVAVSCLSIMNQGSSISQRALEITLVRQEMDSQAETLRYLNAAYIAAYQPGVAAVPGTAADEWAKISALPTATTSISALDVGTSCHDPYVASQKNFILNSRLATMLQLTAANSSKAQTYSQVSYDNANGISSANGIWIEAVKFNPDGTNNQSTAGYIDFHIRACWDSPGQSAPMTLGTIVRLYEPVGSSTGMSATGTTAVIATIVAPDTPTVFVPTLSGNMLTWSWSGVTCVAGAVSYQYNYSIDDGYNSGWKDSSGDPVSFTVPQEGYTATLQVKARCYDGINSRWSGVGAKSYLVPVNPPGAIAFSISRTGGINNEVILSATSSCTGGAHIISRVDAALTWNFWWNGTSQATGWYANSHSGVWAWNDMADYGNPINFTITMSVKVPSRKQFGIAVEMQCQNWATSQVSASTGRRETMALYAP